MLSRLLLFLLILRQSAAEACTSHTITKPGGYNYIWAYCSRKQCARLTRSYPSVYEDGCLCTWNKSSQKFVKRGCPVPTTTTTTTTTLAPTTTTKATTTTAVVMMIAANAAITAAPAITTTTTAPRTTTTTTTTTQIPTTSSSTTETTTTTTTTTTTLAPIVELTTGAPCQLWSQLGATLAAPASSTPAYDANPDCSTLRSHFVYSTVTNASGASTYTVSPQTSGLSQLVNEIIGTINFLKVAYKQLMDSQDTTVDFIKGARNKITTVLGTPFTDAGQLSVSQASNGGSFLATQLLSKAAADALYQATQLGDQLKELTNALVTSALGDTGWVPAYDEAALKGSQEMVKGWWTGFDADVADNSGVLDNRLITINASLQASVGQQYSNALENVHAVSRELLSTNRTLTTSERALLPQLAELSRTLNGLTSAPPLNGLSMLASSTIEAVTAALGKLLDESKKSFTGQSGRAITGASETFTTQMSVADMSVEQYMQTLHIKLNEAGFNATMSNALNLTNSSAASEVSQVEEIIGRLAPLVIGRVTELATATSTASIISHFVDSEGDKSTLQGVADAMKRSIDDSEASLRDDLGKASGEITNSFFPAVMQSIRDIAEQRNLMLQTTASNLNAMQSAMASLASSVGMTLDEFQAQLQSAQTAMQSLMNSSNSLMASGAANTTAEAESMVKSLSSSLDSAAASVTAGATAGSSAVNGIGGAAGGYSNGISNEANTRAANTETTVNSALSGLEDTDSNINGQVRQGVTDMSSTRTALNQAEGDANYANSRVSSITADGLKMLADAAAQISPAFTTMKSTVSSLTDRVNNQLSDQIKNAEADKTTGLGVAAGNYVLDLHDTIEDLLDKYSEARSAMTDASMQPVIDALSGAIFDKRGLQAGYWSGAYQLFKKKVTDAEPDIQTLRGTFAEDLGDAQTDLTGEFSAKAEELSGRATKMVDDDYDVMSGVQSSLDEQGPMITISNISLQARKITAGKVLDEFASLHNQAEELRLNMLAAVNNSAGLLESVTDANKTGNDLLVAYRRFISSGLTDPYNHLQFKKKQMLDWITGNMTNISDQVASIKIGSANESTSGAKASVASVAVADLVRATSNFTDTESSFVSGFINKTNSESEVDSLLPFFALVNDSRAYARSVVANSGGASANAVAEAASAALSSSYETASASQSQSAASLMSSQAYAALELAGSDFAMKQNEQEANMTATSVAQATAGLQAAASASLRGALAKAQEANEAGLGSSADFSAGMGAALANISDGLAASILSIAQTGDQSAEQAQQVIVSVQNTLKRFTTLQNAQKSNDVVSQAKAGVQALVANILDNARNGEDFVSGALTKAVAAGKIVENAASGQVKLSNGLVNSESSLSSARSQIKTFLNSDVVDIERSIKAMLNDRKHAAAEKVVEVYQAITKNIASLKTKAAKMMNIQLV